MYYRFSVDDNIWFLRDLSNNDYSSLFDHPYLKLYKNLHDRYGARFQLNIYYETDGFNLSQMTDRYKNEWIENSSWLKLSFHARADTPPDPYRNASYEAAFSDCDKVHREIIRFAGKETLEYFTTIHYCVASTDAIKAFSDCGVRGLVGLFNSNQDSYGLHFDSFDMPYYYDTSSDIFYFVNDMIINMFPLSAVEGHLRAISKKEFVEVMIHEQYFYEDGPWYQSDFSEKVESCIRFLTEKGKKPVFLSELITLI